MATDYKSKSRKFALRGVDLSRPVDLLDPLSVVVARNVRGYVDGTIHTRPGAAALNASAMAGGAVHSTKRLNDDVGPVLSTPTQAYARFAGAGTKLYADNSTHDAFTEIASGLSGNPLTSIPHRPEQSPQPWLYIHDTNKLLKAKASAAGDATKSYQWGIDPPNVPVSIAIGSPLRKIIDDCEAGTFGGWAASAGTLTNEDRVAAIVITYILFDTGTTGWACVNPASIGEIREGMDLTTSASAETVTVDSIYKAITTTTISSIQYDSGTTGLCTIQLAAPTAELVMNSMLRIAAAENVRVLSVTYGPDGIPSFRCSTTATRSAGDAVAGLASFRAHFANTHAAAETLSGKMLQEITAGAGITTLSRTVALDLSTFGSRPVLPSDVMVIEMNVDNPALITEIQVQLDVDASTNTFTENYYFKAISPSDLTPVVQQTLTQLTVQQRVLQRDQIRGQISRATTRNMDGFISIDPDLEQWGLLPEPLPEIDQTATGANQWSVIKFPISQLLAGRVGSDGSRGLKDVAAIRISINGTAAVTVQVDSWYVTGGYGADSVLPNSSEGGAAPYYWTYRYRDSRTGDRSPWAPLNRSGFETSRNRLVLTPTVSSDPQVDKIDIARIGGTLNEFRIVGTMPNSGTFNDDFPDDVAAVGDFVPQLDVRDIVQPFPVVDIPRSGTCDVRGTEVIWQTGDKFNVNALKANQILINNVPYHLYAQPTDDEHLSLAENAGTQNDVSFFIPDAVLGGQTLDAVFGPYGVGESEIVFFGVRQGVLYWTNGNDPSVCRVENQLEVTSGSESLMNGILYDSRPYLLSDERMFEIVRESVLDSAGNIQHAFRAPEVANSKGLFARWGVCVGTEAIYVVAADGIYSSQGGQFNKISRDLGPLMPHDGIAGVAVNGIDPPDFTQPNKHRLEFGDNKVKWSFIDTGGIYRTWVYDTVKQGWESLDKYAFEGLVHYFEEGRGVHSELIGGKDGKIYQVGGTTDGGTAIACELKTGCEDAGETRLQKQFGDVQLDVNTGSVNLTAKVMVDNLTVEAASVTVNNAAREYKVLDIDSGEGVIARNIGLHLTWSGYVVLYEWNPSYIPRADQVLKRATDWYVFPGTMYVRGLVIEADTEGVSRTVKVQADGLDTGITLTVNHNGQIPKGYGFVPFTAHSVRLLPADANTWRFFEIRKWEVDEYPELQQIYTAILDQNKPGDKYVRGLLLEADSSGVAVNVGIYADGVLATTISVNASGKSAKDFIFSPPFIAREIQLIPAGNVRIFRQDWQFDDYPEFNSLITPWQNDGIEGAKYIRGILLDADTNGSLLMGVVIQKDGGVTGATFDASHFNGRSEAEYPFATPFVSHETRIVPPGPIRIFGYKLVFDPYPDIDTLITPWTKETSYAR